MSRVQTAHHANGYVKILQKIKGVGANQNYDVNSLRSCMISYLNSIILLPPPPKPPISQNLVSSTCMDKLERTIHFYVTATHQANK